MSAEEMHRSIEARSHMAWTEDSEGKRHGSASGSAGVARQETCVCVLRHEDGYWEGLSRTGDKVQETKECLQD